MHTERSVLEFKNETNVTTDKAKRSNCLAWFLDFSIQKKARGNVFDLVQKNLEYNHQLKKECSKNLVWKTVSESGKHTMLSQNKHWPYFNEFHKCNSFDLFIAFK